MSREIKFRAYDSLHKDMSEPFTLGGDFKFLCADHEYHTVPQDCIHNDQFTLMQFTGLKDKKGVDIYEGDIISWENDGEEYEYPVNYINTNYRSGFDFGHSPNPKYFEVIGNIHQNHELLER